ncbi:MAG: VWA domain-containing protein [Spirochaetales bacterium]|nr:VWA domain-containing protein [Spirochaetales bacterium]
MKNPEILLLLLVPLAVFYTALKTGTDRSDFFYTVTVYRRKKEAASLFKIKYFYLAVLYCFGMSLIILSLSSPFVILKNKKEDGGLSSAFLKDTLFVFDISRSMLSDDGDGESRLEKSKKAAAEIISRTTGRSGIVIFKGDAYTLIPLAENRHNAVIDSLSGISPDIYSQAGTDIGKGLSKALASFPLHEKTEKIIYLFTDGEEPEKGSFDDTAQAIGKKIRDNNISLFIIPPDRKSASPVPGSDILSTPDFEMIGELGNLPGARVLSYNEIIHAPSAPMETAGENDLSRYFTASGILILLAALFLKGIKWRGII